MRGPDQWALAARKPSGEITVLKNPSDTIATRHPRLNVFPFRGVVVLLDSLIIGFRAITMSADIALAEEGDDGDAPGGEERDGEDATGDTGDVGEGRGEKKALGILYTGFAIALALVIFLGLFIVLPVAIAKSMDESIHSDVLYNLLEGGIRVAIFIGYLVAVSLMPDIRRVFQYHGAEHKVVHAYEAGDPLTPEAADRYSTAHMRCGTTFILVILVISVLVFSLLGRPALWLRVLERLLLIPVVATVSYEIIRFAGKHERSLVVRVIMAPGLLLQKLTTRKPDEQQLEVAITALEAAMEPPQEESQVVREA